MRFHDHRTIHTAYPQESVRKMPYEKFFPSIFSLHAKTMKSNKNDFAIVQMLMLEHSWRNNRRPFYNVYPSVISCLENTRLSFNVSSLGFSLPPTAICFPEDQEPRIDGRHVSSVMFCISQESVKVSTSNTNEVPFLDSVAPTGNTFMMRINFLDYVSGSCDRILFSAKDTNIDSWGLGSNTNIVSLCVGITMLARDERFAEHILLAKDESRSFNNKVDLELAIERAKNRGRNGISIGKYIDVSPHMRRPHFGIRWTGKGRSIPRLVPIAGSLVSRSKLFPIPTGYLDDVDDQLSPPPQEDIADVSPDDHKPSTPS